MSHISEDPGFRELITEEREVFQDQEVKGEVCIDGQLYSAGCLIRTKYTEFCFKRLTERTDHLIEGRGDMAIISIKVHNSEEIIELGTIQVSIDSLVQSPNEISSPART